MASNQTQHISIQQDSTISQFLFTFRDPQPGSKVMLLYIVFETVSSHHSDSPDSLVDACKENVCVGVLRFFFSRAILKSRTESQITWRVVFCIIETVIIKDPGDSDASKWWWRPRFEH